MQQQVIARAGAPRAAPCPDQLRWPRLWALSSKTDAHTGTSPRTLTQTRLHAHSHRHVHTHTHMRTHMCPHTCAHARAHVHRLSQTRTYTQTTRVRGIPRTHALTLIPSLFFRRSESIILPAEEETEAQRSSVTGWAAEATVPGPAHTSPTCGRLSPSLGSAPEGLPLGVKVLRDLDPGSPACAHLSAEISSRIVCGLWCVVFTARPWVLLLWWATSGHQTGSRRVVPTLSLESPRHTREPVPTLLGPWAIGNACSPIHACTGDITGTVGDVVAPDQPLVWLWPGGQPSPGGWTTGCMPGTQVTLTH